MRAHDVGVGIVCVEVRRQRFGGLIPFFPPLHGFWRSDSSRHMLSPAELSCHTSCSFSFQKLRTRVPSQVCLLVVMSLSTL